MLIIGITGKLHSGKDTVADYLSKHFTGSIKRGFADALKEIGMNIFGFSEKQMYEQEEKEKVDPFWNISTRAWNQHIGTLLRTQYREDVWIKLMEKYIQTHANCSFFIIPDVRYDNEAEFIRKQGGLVIQVNRAVDNSVDSVVRNHSSEHGISYNKISLTVDNTKTLSELYEQLDKLIAEIQVLVQQNLYKKGDKVLNKITGNIETVSSCDANYVFTQEISPEGTPYNQIERLFIQPPSYEDALNLLGEIVEDKMRTKRSIITEVSETYIGLGTSRYGYEEVSSNFQFPDGTPIGTYKKV